MVPRRHAQEGGRDLFQGKRLARPGFSPSRFLPVPVSPRPGFSRPGFSHPGFSGFSMHCTLEIPFFAIHHQDLGVCDVLCAIQAAKMEILETS